MWCPEDLNTGLETSWSWILVHGSMAQCGTEVDSGVVLVLVTSLTPTRNTANTSADDG